MALVVSVMALTDYTAYSAYQRTNVIGKYRSIGKR